jgi:hypothetical protein
MGPLAVLVFSLAIVLLLQSFLGAIDVPTGAGNFFSPKKAIVILFEELLDGL